MVIVGDIGGTKTDLAIYADGANPNSPLARKQFHSSDYSSLQAMVTQFLAETKFPASHAAFGIAGPVINGRVVTTNLPWVTDEESLARDLKLQSVRLMNDLEAVARAIPILAEADIVTVNPGEAVPMGAVGVIAPGTGLGESFLTWDGTEYVPQGSEGGHSDFAPTDNSQIRLLEYLISRYKHVSVERVCSGSGIPNIYAYLRDVEKLPESAGVAQRIASADDPTRAIVEAAISPDNESPLCRATVDMFVSILGSEAGNLALKILATGGIYLAGGVMVHTLSVVQGPAFMRAFINKGRFTEFMRRIPVHAITTNAALLGAANYALQKAGKLRS